MGLAHLLSLCLVVVGACVVNAAVVEYNFTVVYDFQAPDCVTKLLYTVNGLYPGPTIQVTSGDTVVVHVTNQLFDEDTSIHFHGLQQRGTPFYDGVAKGSQCGILPGETFTYTISTVGQVGTYWWHSHVALQRSNGLYGAFIILAKPSVNEAKLLGYSAELEPLLLNDWYHMDTITQQAGLFKKLPQPFVFVGTGQSLLVNGKGVFNCSNTEALFGLSCNSTNPDCGYPVFDVKPKTTYRLRLVAVTSLSYLTFGIEGHKLTVVEADGNYVEPVVVDYLDINSAQSYSVLLTTGKSVGNYWISITPRFRAPPYPGPGGAILRYAGAPVLIPSTPLLPPPIAYNNSAFSKAQQRSIKTRKGYEELIPPYTRELILVGTQNRVNGYLKWAVNNHSYVFPSTPPLLAQYFGILGLKDTGAFDKPAHPFNYTLPFAIAGVPSAGIGASINYDVKLNSVVQIVLQNTRALNNNSEQHPWHLHGHDFWVLGWGEGIYDPKVDQANFNLKNPIKRNVVTLFPLGWVAIRYVADNPGFWPFHCHIESHLAMGMQVGILEGKEKLPLLPADFPTCGAITTSLIRSVNPSLPSVKGHHPFGQGHHPPRHSKAGGHHPPGKGHHPPGK